MPDNHQNERRRSTDAQVIKLEHTVEELRTEVKELKADIRELIEAWKAAKGMTSFVKWLSGMVIAVGTVYAALRGWKP